MEIDKQQVADQAMPPLPKRDPTPIGLRLREFMRGPGQFLVWVGLGLTGLWAAGTTVPRLHARSTFPSAYGGRCLVPQPLRRSAARRLHMQRQRARYLLEGAAAAAMATVATRDGLQGEARLATHLREVSTLPRLQCNPCIEAS